MVDSDTRMSTMVKISIEKMLTISHVEDLARVIDLRALGTSEEGAKKYEALILRRLNFDERICHAVEAALRQRQESNLSWKKVELRNVDGDVASAIAACFAIDTTEEIHLVINNVDIPHAGWIAISEGIQALIKLQCLRITTCLYPRCIQVFSQGLQNATSSLHNLDLSWSTFESGDAVEALTLGLRQNTTLQELHCMGCSLNDEHMAWLLEALRDHPTLKCLDLNGNKCGPAASFALAELLTSDTHLQKLDVSFQTSDERMRVPQIVEGLRNNNSLKILELSNCGLDDADAVLLGQLLCDHPNILELYIARNKITDDGISEFAGMLPHITSLRRISLWGNPFGDHGAQALADGMKGNLEIEEMDLFRNFFCSDKITLYTHLNRAGRRLLHYPERVPLGLWPLVVSRINCLSFQKNSTINASDSIFHMIRGPALFDCG